MGRRIKTYYTNEWNTKGRESYQPGFFSPAQAFELDTTSKYNYQNFPSNQFQGGMEDPPPFYDLISNSFTVKLVEEIEYNRITCMYLDEHQKCFMGGRHFH
jgi:hypothetical protein